MIPAVDNVVQTGSGGAHQEVTRAPGQGTIAFFGGEPFKDPNGLQDSNGIAEVLESLLGGVREVAVLPTASAYENPSRALQRIEAGFDSLGIGVRAVMVMSRRDALDEGNAETLAESKCVYFMDGSPLHLVSVLKGTPSWEAILGAWQAGARILGVAGGAMALTDPMVDPRGGALTVGLGLMRSLALVPHYGGAEGEKFHRSIILAGGHVLVAGVPETRVLVRHPEGTWESLGSDMEVALFRAGKPVGLEELSSVRPG